MEQEKTTVFPAVEFPEFTPVSYEAWKEEATASLKGAPFEKKLLTKTYEGITLEPLYTAAHAAAFGAKEGYPGAPDYLRGADAAGYLGEPWLIAQKSVAKVPQAAGEILAEELERGATAIAADLTDGLPLETLADLEAFLKPLGGKPAHPFQIHTGALATPFLGLITAYAEAHGLDTKQFCGVIGADPLGRLAQTGELAGSLESHYEQLAVALRFAQANMPQIKTICIQGSVYHNGGASAVQELAACFTAALSYLDALTERGFAVDEAAAAISFEFSLGSNFFMEIAKLRAARMIWSQIVTAAGGSAEAAKLSASARTSTFTTTVYDPYVNVLRATTQAFSGVLGGLDALTVTPFDAACRCGDTQSRRIARNIQVMLQNEFNALAPIDAAGGSWYLETLTGQLAEAAWKLLQQIEGEGGLAQALASGSLQAGIAETLAARFKNLATRKDVAVGTNMYANLQEESLKGKGNFCGKSCPKQEYAAVSWGIVGEGKPSAQELMQGIKNTFTQAKEPVPLSVIAAGLVEGEAARAEAIQPHRWTEQFEALRQRTDAYQAKTGKNIQVFLANLGPIPQHKARADFSAGFMEVAGFEVLRNDGFATPAEAAQAALATQAPVVVICSTDATYPELVPELAKVIKDKAPNTTVLLAGAPAAEHKDAYDSAGVDDYIHVKANCLGILTQIQEKGGVC